MKNVLVYRGDIPLNITGSLPILLCMDIVEMHGFGLSTRLPTTEGAPVFRLTVNTFPYTLS